MQRGRKSFGNAGAEKVGVREWEDFLLLQGFFVFLNVSIVGWIFTVSFFQKTWMENQMDGAASDFSRLPMLDGSSSTWNNRFPVPCIYSCQDPQLDGDEFVVGMLYWIESHYLGWPSSAVAFFPAGNTQWCGVVPMASREVASSIRDVEEWDDDHVVEVCESSASILEDECDPLRVMDKLGGRNWNLWFSFSLSSLVFEATHLPDNSPIDKLVHWWSFCSTRDLRAPSLSN